MGYAGRIRFLWLGSPRPHGVLSLALSSTHGFHGFISIGIDCHDLRAAPLHDGHDAGGHATRDLSGGDEVCCGAVLC